MERTYTRSFVDLLMYMTNRARRLLDESGAAMGCAIARPSADMPVINPDLANAVFDYLIEMEYIVAVHSTGAAHLFTVFIRPVK